MSLVHLLSLNFGKNKVHSVVLVSDSDDEPVTRGSPYNFAVLNSPITGHLGKMTISFNW